MSGLVTSAKLTQSAIHSKNTKVEDISLSLQLTGQEAKKYTTLLYKFEQYFVKHRNVINEHCKFNQHVQESDETVIAFITVLCKLLEICNYGQLN